MNKFKSEIDIAIDMAIESFDSNDKSKSYAKLHELIRHLRSISIAMSVDKTPDDISRIIERHKGKVIRRTPCCDKPTPKTVTTSRGNSKRIGDYAQHTECANCGKRW